MADTTPLGFPFPEDGDYSGSGADVPRAVQELAEALDDFLTDQYRLISIRYVTGGVTFEPTAGVDALFVECVGGGGAGGGCITAVTNSAAGGGGGAGGYAATWVTTMKHPFTISVGTGGIGASGSAGGAGGVTTFDSPAVCTGNGGFGGGVKTVSAPPQIGGFGGEGSGGTGDLGVTGGPGLYGVMLAAAHAIGGAGGSSHFGGGAVGVATQSAGQVANGGYGGGGGGGCILSGGASVAGGNGRPGLIRVFEYQTLGPA